MRPPEWLRRLGDLRVRRSEYSRWSLYVYRRTPCLEYRRAGPWQDAAYGELGFYFDWRNRGLWRRLLGMLVGQPFPPRPTRPPVHVNCRCVIVRRD